MDKEVFKTYRTAKRLTQSQLADKMGLSLRAIQHYEKGTRPIPKIVENFIKLIK